MSTKHDKIVLNCLSGDTEALHHEKECNSPSSEYFSQKELAKRWRMSESTIINLREKGELPVFRPPGCVRPLYPVELIFILEKCYTKTIKEVISKSKQSDIMRKKPVVSKPSEPSEIKWRV